MRQINRRCLRNAPIHLKTRVTGAQSCVQVTQTALRVFNHPHPGCRRQLTCERIVCTGHTIDFGSILHQPQWILQPPARRAAKVNPARNSLRPVPRPKYTRHRPRHIFCTHCGRAYSLPASFVVSREPYRSIPQVTRVFLLSAPATAGSFHLCVVRAWEDYVNHQTCRCIHEHTLTVPVPDQTPGTRRPGMRLTPDRIHWV